MGNKGSILGGLLARTQGKFRPGFLARLAAHNPALIDDNLVAWYGKIAGKEITVEQLRSEAGL